MAFQVIEDLPEATQGVDQGTKSCVDVVSIQLSPRRTAPTRPFEWLQTNETNSNLDRLLFRLMIYSIPLCPREDTVIDYDPTQHGRDLAQALKNHNVTERERERPLVFICYSFGCPTLQQAIKYMQSPENGWLFAKIKGIIFSGSVHNYGNGQYERTVTSCMAAELSLHKSHRIIKHWASTAQPLLSKDISINFFQNTVHGWKTSNLISTKETSIKKRLRSPKNIMLIPYDLAQPPPLYGDSTTWKKRTIEADYYELSTYPRKGTVFAKCLREEFCSLTAAMINSSLHSQSSPTVGDEQNDYTQPSIATLSVQTINPIPSTASMPIQQASHIVDTQPSFDLPNLPCRMLRPYQSNRDFVGREDTLKVIEENLNPNSSRVEAQSFALIAYGGMGKTQTGLAYTFKHLEDFGAIVLVQAINDTAALQAFAEFARDLGLVSDTDDQTYAKDQLFRWFDNTDTPWLVFFDNADPGDIPGQSSDNVALLEKYWPTGKAGSILVTSQDMRVAKNFAKAHIELKPFTDEEALELLYRQSEVHKTRSNREAAMKIVQGLDKLPFAINVAAKMISENTFEFTDYLRIYDNYKLLREGEPLHGPGLHYKQTLRSVWAVSYNRLPDETKDLLNIIAFLDPLNIKESMLKEGVRKPPSHILDFLAGDNLSVHRGKLSLSPLVLWNKSLRVLSMHRIVQQSCHYHMATARQIAFDRAVLVVSGNWPRPEMHNRRQHSMWDVQKEFILHVLSLHDYYKLSLSEDEQTFTGKLTGNYYFAELLYLAAWYYVERGFLSSAEPLLNTAKDLCVNHIPESELLLADIYGGYGAIDSERNKLVETLDDFEKQYEYLMKAFQKSQWKRPDVREALALGGLAQGYAGMDRFREAEDYYRRCVKAWEDAPGEPTIYKSHLGTCLAFQGELDEAEQILRGEIDDRAQRFGPRDTTSYRTGLLYYALENVMRRRGPEKYEEAFQIAEACLHMFRETIGAEHHSTADALYKVAWHCHFFGDYDRAESNLKEALAIYGSNSDYNTEIARTQYLLSVVYGDTNKGTDCKRWKKRAEDLRQTIMGDSYSPGQNEDDYDRLVNFWSR